ncbi:MULTISPECIES: hypothetical protein [unclassified Bradyrhizobium]|uniref:hypothetical protein n=1 Tax=unclassified Bradyrhizobium TaxID=2631580 RepID=UPI00247B2ABD|nr:MULTISPECIES: hypothetical protein [unclassified Bradyrhizobium]WGS19764.1 hypothetical protein MTX22_36415 [Bradyrhizobium sp. ISRA463]WGS26609.1 hypothetical protein MTX19_33870 [Bradyrhizobium sp. ISRA464]
MSREHHHIRYVPESPNVGMAFVGWSALGALLLLVVSIGGLYGIYHAVAPPRGLPAPQAFPQPRVDTSESEELRRITDAHSKTLETWQWADQQHSTVQVPIERAMQLLVKKGGSAYEPLLSSPEAALSAPTAAGERTTIQQGKSPSAAPKGAQSPPEPGK